MGTIQTLTVDMVDYPGFNTEVTTSVMLSTRLSIWCLDIEYHVSCNVDCSCEIVTGDKSQTGKRLSRKCHACSVGIKLGEGSKRMHELS